MSRGDFTAAGYSGRSFYLNDPNSQNLPKEGPIPQGLYTIGQPRTDEIVGPFALPLTPDPSNEMFGRADFFIHGDEIAHPGQHLASDGCIILDRPTRQTIWGSGDTLLQVVSGTVVTDPELGL
jgi:type VI secretion system (T6SS) effector TldE1-like protein